MSAGDACLCGCGRLVLRGREHFASQACYWATVRAGRFPQWRERRRQTFQRRAAARAQRFGSKSAAYTAGYRAGYHAAWAYWRDKYRRAHAQNVALRKGRAA